MKNWILIGMLSLGSLAHAKTITAHVDGMVCAFCSQGLTKRLGKEAAVEKVKVDLDKKLVTVDLKDGQDLSDTQLREHITKAGFNVAKIER